MAKKVRAIIKLQLEAGKATPAPPVGPALGQHSVNIMGFVKEYNSRTANQVGTIVPVHLTVLRRPLFYLRNPYTSGFGLAKESGSRGERGLRQPTGAGGGPSAGRR